MARLVSEQDASKAIPLDRELSSLNAVLIPTKTQPLEREEWERRVAALDRLTALAQARALTAAHCQPLLSRWVRRAVIVQLADPRSTVVKAACAFIVAFAEGTCSESNASTATVCSWWVPSLFKCTASMTLVVSEAAQAALDSLTRHDVWNYESTSALLQACESKHSRTRCHALSTLTHRLQRVQGTSHLASFSTFSAALRRVLRAALEDADREVRQRARTTLVAFEAVSPPDAARVLATLDPATRSAVASSRAAAEQELALLSSPSSSRAAGAGPEGRSRKDSAASASLSVSVFDLSPTTRTLDDDLLAAAAEKARQIRYVSPTKARRRRSSAAPQSRVGGAGRPPPTSPPRRPPYELLRDHLRSRDWATRTAALKDVEALFLSDASASMAAFTRQERQALMELIVPLTESPNVHVAEGAHRAVRCLAECDATLVQPYVAHLCGVLLRFAASRRKDSRNAAVLLLETLLQIANGGVFSAAVVHTLSAEPTPAVRLRGVEVLSHTIARKPADVEAAGTVPSILRCLAAELSQESARSSKSLIWPAAISAIACLYERLPTAFAKACAQLTGSDLRVVSEALRVSHPELDAPESDSAQTLGSAAATSPETIAVRVTVAPTTPPVASADPKATTTTTTFEELVADAADVSAEGKHRTMDPPSPSARAVRQRRASPLRPFTLPIGAGASSSSSSRAPDHARDISERVQSLLFSLCTPQRDALTGLRFDKPVDSRFYDDDGPGKATGMSAPHSLEEALDALKDATSGLTTTQAVLHSLDALTGHLECGEYSRAELDDCALRFVGVLSPLSVEVSQADHRVRRRALTCLRVFLLRCGVAESPESMRAWLPKRLTALLALSRAGLDDAFVEVRQEASILLDFVLQSRVLSTEQCLNALCECLGRWLQGPSADDVTPGWLALLQEIGACLQRHEAVPNGRAGHEGHDRTLSKVVVSRVCAQLHIAAAHCAVEVRRVAMLTFAALWSSLGERSYPFLLSLSPTERQLVSVLYNRALQQVQQQLPVTLGGYHLLLPPPQTTDSAALPWRDLNAELQTYESRQ